MGDGLLAGTPSVCPRNTVKSVAVAVTGKGSRNNTVGQAWGSRRGECDGHLRETHPGPRRHTHKGHTGTHGSMRTQSHEDTKEDKGRGGYKVRHTQRNGDGQAGLVWRQPSGVSSPVTLRPWTCKAGRAGEDGPAGCSPPWGQAVGSGAGASRRRMGPCPPGRGCSPRVELCPLGLCRRCSCPQLQCSRLQRKVARWGGAVGSWAPGSQPPWPHSPLGPKSIP